MLKFTRFQSPIGHLPPLAVKEGVLKISFESKSRDDIDKWCQSHLGMGAIEETDFTNQARN